MKEIIRFVLTGGPCAGKTEAQKRIKQEFTKKGYKVILVDEAATDLILSGKGPSDKISVYEFQDSIIKKQLEFEREAMARAMAAKEDKVLILYDRGLRDGAAYLNDGEFNKLLELNNLKDEEINDRYDAVFFLITSAIGAEKFYNLENKARRENLQEAKELDGRTRKAWESHDRVEIIDNSTGFKEKIDRLIASMDKAIIDIANEKDTPDYLVIYNALQELEIRIDNLRRTSNSEVVKDYILQLFGNSEEIKNNSL